MNKYIDLADDIVDLALDAIFPHRRIVDLYHSDFNKKHRIIGLNPLNNWITPFDLTPVGWVGKAAKGSKLIYSGVKLVSMGFSGYGKKNIGAGAYKLLSSVGGKVYSMLSGPVEASSKSFQQNEDPRPPIDPIKKPVRLKKSIANPYAYKPNNSKCRPGYRLTKTKNGIMCIRQ